jgi:choline dehydrogenase-like flavoprotein
VVDAYDVIVIRSGAGGGTLTHHLAASAKRILLLVGDHLLERIGAQPAG